MAPGEGEQKKDEKSNSYQKKGFFLIQVPTYKNYTEKKIMREINLLIFINFEL